MKKRILLFLLFIIFCLSAITFFMILNYFDPYEYRILAFISIIITFLLWWSSILALILYFVKKIYLRGKVYMYHVLSSFRQWFLFSLFCLGIIFLNIVSAPVVLTGLGLAFLLLFIEMFFQNLEN